MKTMDWDEFHKGGYLQEINRLFLHPLGLAMAVEVDGNSGKCTGINGILDDREDPEGWYYGDITPEEVARGLAISRELERRSQARIAALGYVIQPLRAEESS